jgi:Ca2+/Na+ antiporter
LDIGMMLAGLALLLGGGEGLVRGGVALATRMRLPMAVVGAVVLGFGTSMPEMLTSVSAALAGAPGIAIGNVLGSNIANILADPGRGRRDRADPRGGGRDRGPGLACRGDRAGYRP